MGNSRISRSRPATGVSRRSFLSAASALAVPLVVPASVLGRGEDVAPSERIGLGFIGVGGRGMSHLRGMLGNSGVRVAAACDPLRAKVRAAAESVKKRYGEPCAITDDFRTLLARDDIDAVFIASPENWHALQAARAAEAGKDVYCEKALSLTIDEGRALCQTVRRHGSMLQVGTQQRSDRKFRFACELARGGYLGALREVRVGVPGGRELPVAKPAPVPDGLSYDLWLGPAQYTPYNDLKCTFNWYFVSDYCAGWIESWGVHHCDVAVWGAPELARGKVKVKGSATFPKEGLADTSVTWHVEMATPGGPKLSFADNRHPGHQQGCRFVGEKGEVFVNRGAISANPASLLDIVIPPEKQQLQPSTNHHGDFLDSIRTRRDPVAPVEAGHAATTVTLVADIATRLGRELTWDWATESFVGDDEANRMTRRPMRAPWNLISTRA